jgi:hypothetical protein
MEDAGAALDELARMSGKPLKDQYRLYPPDALRSAIAAVIKGAVEMGLKLSRVGQAPRA